MAPPISPEPPVTKATFPSGSIARPQVPTIVPSVSSDELRRAFLQIRPHRLHLDLGRRPRHDDLRADAQPARGEGDALGVIPGARRDDSPRALGCVQVAGAASLGEGRLGSFRVDIFERCQAGTALDDRRISTRLARLLATTPQTAAPPEAAASLPCFCSTAVSAARSIRASLFSGTAASQGCRLRVRYRLRSNSAATPRLPMTGASAASISCHKETMAAVTLAASAPSAASCRREEVSRWWSALSMDEALGTVKNA